MRLQRSGFRYCHEITAVIIFMEATVAIGIQNFDKLKVLIG
ncbi:MAG: hypothetical protein SO160_05250 [Lachnospiraceae bacterium]|nr:hypothetical protein [Lachnospiraceae bacterium]